MQKLEMYMRMININIKTIYDNTADSQQNILLSFLFYKWSFSFFSPFYLDFECKIKQLDSKSVPPFDMIYDNR